MGRGGHAGCNRSRVAWVGGTVAALASAWLLVKAAVNFLLVVVFYGMLAMVAYSKRELLSSYCRPPGSDWIQNTMVPGMDDEDDEWAEPTPTRKAQEEEERSQAASSGLAARLEAAFAAEEKRKQAESASRAKPVRVVAPDDDDYEFDEDAIEADEDAYFNPGASGRASKAPAPAPSTRDALDDEADEFF